MKRFSRKQTDQLVAELTSITFDTTGLHTDLERIHIRCIRSVEMLWNLKRTKAVDKYIRIQLPLTIHRSLMICINEADLSVEVSHKFIKDSFEYCVPALDEWSNILE